MRKVISWTLSWLFYWLGDAVSRPMEWFDCMFWLYPVYNKLMIWSYNLQVWGGDLGPWRDCNG